MRHLCFLLLATATGLSVGCKTDEREISKAATWLCSYGQLVDLNETAWPQGEAMDAFIHPDDLVAIAPHREPQESLLAAGLREAARAYVEARARNAKCTVKQVEIAGDTAQASVSMALPVAPANLPRFQELAALPSFKERLKTANQWFASSSEVDSNDIVAEFRKTPQGWRRFYDKKAHFEQLQHAEAMQQISKEVTALALDGMVREAKTRLDEALAKHPDDPILKMDVDMLEPMLADLVAGNWRRRKEVDAMTDDKNVFVSLPASNKVNAVVNEVRPRLIGRCSERKPALFLNVGTGVDADYGEYYRATGRIRFGTEPAQRIRFTIADSRDAVFFQPPARWMGLMESKESVEMVVEVPTYRYGSQLVRFDLAGASKAFEEVRAACGMR